MQKRRDHSHDHRKTSHADGEGADETTHVFSLACADVLGDYDSSGIGEAHGQEGQQIVQVAADGYRGKTGFADDVSHDDHVHQVVDHLEHVPEEQRGSELNEPAGDVAGGEVVHQFLVGRYSVVRWFFVFQVQASNISLM